MTPDHAAKIVERIFSRFPRAHLSPGVLSAWAGALTKYDFQMATSVLTGPVKGWTGEYPPPLNGLLQALQRQHAELHKEPEPPEIPDATLEHSARTPVHKKYLAMIKHIQANAPSHLHPREPAKFRPANRDRIDARLEARYGYRWWYDEQWGQNPNGTVTPKGGMP